MLAKELVTYAQHEAFNSNKKLNKVMCPRE